jgi:hypothetical protein
LRVTTDLVVAFIAINFKTRSAATQTAKMRISLLSIAAGFVALACGQVVPPGGSFPTWYGDSMRHPEKKD